MRQGPTQRDARQHFQLPGVWAVAGQLPCSPVVFGMCSPLLRGSLVISPAGCSLGKQSGKSPSQYLQAVNDPWFTTGLLNHHSILKFGGETTGKIMRNRSYMLACGKKFLNLFCFSHMSNRKLNPLECLCLVCVCVYLPQARGAFFIQKSSF